MQTTSGRSARPGSHDRRERLIGALVTARAVSRARAQSEAVSLSEQSEEGVTATVEEGRHARVAPTTNNKDASGLLSPTQEVTGGIRHTSVVNQQSHGKGERVYCEFVSCET